MADLTSVSTQSYSVQGNRKVVTVDISSAGVSTSDTVTVSQLTAITEIIGVSYRTTTWDAAASTVMVPPAVFIGSSANTIAIARSSLAGFPVRVTVQGR